MASKRTVTKDPQATLDYGFRYTKWLLESGSDTILASTWTVPAGITKVSSSFTATTTTIWLSGGTVGEQYPCVNEVNTVGQRTDNRTLIVNIEQK